MTPKTEIEKALMRRWEAEKAEHRKTMALLGSVTVARDRAEAERDEYKQQRNDVELIAQVQKKRCQELAQQLDAVRKCVTDDEPFGAIIEALWNKPEIELNAKCDAIAAALVTANTELADSEASRRNYIEIFHHQERENDALLVRIVQLEAIKSFDLATFLQPINGRPDNPEGSQETQSPHIAEDGENSIP